MSQNHLSELRFDALDIHEQVQAGIRDAGFEFCTPIQASTLPIALKGHDVAGQAQTGTGKTAAFLIATYQRLLTSTPAEGERKQPRAFMLAPTRELAVQIANDAELLGSHTGFKVGLAYGGTDYEKQRRTIEEGIDILIGTPGRIIDYFKQGVFKLDKVEVAVLDEADRMFDMGFIKDIRYLLRRLPEPDKRLNMLFSATLSHNVMELAYEHMNEPELIRIEPDKVTADKVRQAIFFPSNKEKMPLLVGLIREMGEGRIMVFVNMKREAERVQALPAGKRHRRRRQSPGTCRRRNACACCMDFQSGVLAGPDRHRRRFPRAAHSGRPVRHQLRPAAGRRRLRPSHRPHRARGRRRRCDQFRLRDLCGLSARHRKLHRPQNPGRELRLWICCRS